MFEDFKEDIISKQENDIAKNFLATAQPLNQSTEQATVAHALKIPTQKLKRFQYTDNDRLTVQIFQIYPESTHLTIINNDKRDGLGVPTITTRALRERFTNVSWSQGKRVLHSVNYNIFQICLCIVENGFVNVKIINSEFDMERY